VLQGEFVTANLSGVSERDLAFAFAFLVNKAAPEVISQGLVAGDLATTDAQVRAHGEISGAGSRADLAGLTIAPEEANALSNAKAGDVLNLSGAEITALRVAGGCPGTVQLILAIFDGSELVGPLPLYGVMAVLLLAWMGS
jgi:hypothetical protein